MVAADIAIPWRGDPQSIALILEDFEIRAESTPEESKFSNGAIIRNIQMPRHPIIPTFDRPDRISILAADHFNKEPGCLIEIRDSEADMFDAS